MLKITFITILFALMAPVFAGSFLSHDKFVHLSYQEQRKVVVAVMELVVEMEERYRREVKTSGFDLERFQRYSEFMRKVSNLLFPEAHAARNVRYGQYLNQLRQIVGQRDKCIYAGWISEMRNGKCTHPTNASAQLRNLYQSESGCSGGPNQITCNPAIFGFKNVRQKTLFCVPAGVGFSDNSSRDCMVKALKNPPEQGASSVEERINNMIAGIAANPNDSNAVFDFLIQACACDPSRSPQINRDYAEKIRPHQTCYAILRMLSEFAPRCSVSSQPLDQNQLQFLSNIKGMLTDAQIRINEDPANPNGENVRTLYINGLENLRRDNADFRNAEAAVCGTSPGTGGTDTTTTQECNQETERTPDNRLCCRANRVPKADGSGCEEPSGGSITVDGDSGGNPPGGGDTVVTSDGGDTDTSDVEEIVVTGRRCNRETHEWVGPDESMECLPKCPAGVTRNPTDNSCPQPTATTTPPTCTGENEEPNPDGSGCRCVGGGTRNEDNTCPAPSSSSISITVKATNKTDNTNTTISVTVNPSDYSQDQYTIIWFRRGYPQPTPSNRPGFTPRPDEDVAPSDEETNPEDEDDDNDEEPNTSQVPGENETRIDGKDDQTSFDVDRHASQDYQVCARLIKKSDSSRAADGCATVQKKPAATPNNTRRTNNGGMTNPFMQQQPMMPGRGGSSDAIFRGIR